MTYKIIEKIGKYKIGQEIPDEVGMVLAKMYDKSPVEKIEIKAAKVEAPKVEEPKSVKKKGLFSK